MIRTTKELREELKEDLKKLELLEDKAKLERERLIKIIKEKNLNKMKLNEEDKDVAPSIFEQEAEE